jgi:hypothetical protein
MVPEAYTSPRATSSSIPAKAIRDTRTSMRSVASSTLLRLRYTSTAAPLRIFYGSATALLQTGGDSVYSSSTALLRGSSTVHLWLFYGFGRQTMRGRRSARAAVASGRWTMRGRWSAKRPGLRSLDHGRPGLLVVGPGADVGLQEARAFGRWTMRGQGFRSLDHARTLICKGQS